MTTLKTEYPLFNFVEFSLSGLCNRHCEFCPRYDPNIYPNRNEYLPTDLYSKIILELGGLGFDGLIVYSGFSEPFLHKELIAFVQIARRHLPKARIDVKTNGDFLDARNLRELFEAGLSSILVSLYDGPDTIPNFKTMQQEVGLSDQQFILRPRYLSREENFGLVLSNRAGMVSPHLNIPTKDLPVAEKCYYPFYIVMIDHSGDILLCPHDWGKKLVIGNAAGTTLKSAWESHVMLVVRQKLHQKDRNFGPCKDCSVNGLLQGEKEYERWLPYI